MFKSSTAIKAPEVIDWDKNDGNVIRTKVKAFIVAVKSVYVKEVYFATTMENAIDIKRFEETSVIIGVTGGKDEMEARRKMAAEHLLPDVDLLVAYEIA